MILPNTKVEKKIQKECFGTIIGVDEAGRGPLAGPVVAGAAWVNPKIFEEDFSGRELIRDSKTLSENQRALAFANIEASNDFVFGIGEVSHEMIDEMNILKSTMLAMRLAVEDLMDKMKNSPSCPKRGLGGAIKNKSKEKITPPNLPLHKGRGKDVCILIDGNVRIPGVKHEQRIFPGGDRNIFSISVASICAKFHRDNLMGEFHGQFPEYGFDRHKGYGTRFHMEQLQKHGPCPIHRKTFGPVRDCRL